MKNKINVMGADNFRINTTVKKGHMSPLLCSANPINKSNQKVYMNTNIFPYFYSNLVYIITLSAFYTFLCNGHRSDDFD